MCVQCGCLRPENQAGVAAAWEETARRSGEKRLTDRIASLEAQVARMRMALEAAGIHVPSPPVPEEGKSYHQPGVSW
jgi:hypothetical protein